MSLYADYKINSQCRFRQPIRNIIEKLFFGEILTYQVFFRCCMYAETYRVVWRAASMAFPCIYSLLIYGILRINNMKCIS